MTLNYQISPLLLPQSSMTLRIYTLFPYPDQISIRNHWLMRVIEIYTHGLKVWSILAESFVSFASDKTENIYQYSMRDWCYLYRSFLLGYRFIADNMHFQEWKNKWIGSEAGHRVCFLSWKVTLEYNNTLIESSPSSLKGQLFDWQTTPSKNRYRTILLRDVEHCFLAGIGTLISCNTEKYCLLLHLLKQ